jgi:hypothetical protein
VITGESELGWLKRPTTITHNNRPKPTVADTAKKRAKKTTTKKKSVVKGFFHKTLAQVPR